MKITFKFTKGSPIGKLKKSVRTGSFSNDSREIKLGEFTPNLNTSGELYVIEGSFEHKVNIVIFIPYNFELLKSI